MKEILDTLRNHDISAEPFETTINARFGEGLSENRVNLDLTELSEHLSKAPNSTQGIQAFVRGVKMVLQEAPRSRAANWTFNQAAGRIFPIVESHYFSLGVSAASGSPAFLSPLHGDLVFAYIIETDRGWRCLTAGQAEAWGVTSDRIRAAARSMLYHRTRDLPWLSLDSHVFQLKKGDGFDAARCMVFEDVFFSEVGPQFRFGIPDSDTLLFVRGDSPTELEALKSAVSRVCESSPAPLSAGLYAQDGISLRPADH